MCFVYYFSKEFFVFISIVYFVFDLFFSIRVICNNDREVKVGFPVKLVLLYRLYEIFAGGKVL